MEYVIYQNVSHSLSVGKFLHCIMCSITLINMAPSWSRSQSQPPGQALMPYFTTNPPITAADTNLSPPVTIPTNHTAQHHHTPRPLRIIFANEIPRLKIWRESHGFDTRRETLVEENVLWRRRPWPTGRMAVRVGNGGSRGSSSSGSLASLNWPWASRTAGSHKYVGPAARFLHIYNILNM